MVLLNGVSINAINLPRSVLKQMKSGNGDKTLKLKTRLSMQVFQICKIINHSDSSNINRKHFLQEHSVIIESHCFKRCPELNIMYLVS